MSVTLSSKFQLVLPEELRKRRNYQPGMKFDFIDDGFSVRLVQVKTMKELRGFLKGKMKPEAFQRDESDVEYPDPPKNK
jgi:bifunctional DNA-binding transcriptional regulator/antitoxin component of YhaV-PrlF toxin-antitoxin module